MNFHGAHRALLGTIFANVRVDRKEYSKDTS
jgi:hypothetical protein